MRTHAHPGVGTPRLRLQPVKSPKLGFVAKTTCLCCRRAMDVTFGVIAATFTIGNEFIGVACDDCLVPESRAQLQAQRRAPTREEA
jgi:hypothetical protein